MIELNNHPHTTFTIQNRHGLEVFMRFNGDIKKPLALLAHGLSDTHDSDTMRSAASALIEAGYNVLTWDATHASGRSGGSLGEATLTAAYEDMADVATWAKTQSWYRAPFVLVGHSMGAAAALIFATEAPDLVDRLILIAPVVAGKLAAKRINPLLRFVWRLTGRLPQPGNRKRWFGYNLLRDGLAYDGRRLAPGLRVPTIVLVGGKDKTTPAREARLLWNEIPSEWRHLVIVPQAEHGFAPTYADLEAAVKIAIWTV